MYHIIMGHGWWTIGFRMKCKENECHEINKKKIFSFFLLKCQLVAVQCRKCVNKYIFYSLNLSTRCIQESNKFAFKFDKSSHLAKSRYNSSVNGCVRVLLKTLQIQFISLDTHNSVLMRSSAIYSEFYIKPN